MRAAARARLSLILRDTRGALQRDGNFVWRAVRVPATHAGGSKYTHTHARPHAHVCTSYDVAYIPNKIIVCTKVAHAASLQCVCECVCVLCDIRRRRHNRVHGNDWNGTYVVVNTVIRDRPKPPFAVAASPCVFFFFLHTRTLQTYVRTYAVRHSDAVLNAKNILRKIIRRPFCD